MSDWPVTRSRSQILGEMLNTFIGRTGISGLRVGSPHLAFLEACSRSDVRVAADIIQTLRAGNLNHAQGLALLRHGADESLEFQPPREATGLLTISDSAFTRLQTQIFPGRTPPIIGSTQIACLDAQAWPASGSLYLGRGSQNYEGPIQYSSKAFDGTAWLLTLVTPTTRYHDGLEAVTLAQGGDRLIPAGTQVQTPQGSLSPGQRFATVFAATIPDGEAVLNAIPCRAILAGTGGNVPAGSITSWVGAPPWPSATVLNEAPLTDGRDAETPEAFRERIRAARRNRARATDSTLVAGVLGAQGQEPGAITSARLVNGELQDTLYIDDGRGYEETLAGVGLEILTSEALGGEDALSLSQRPVMPASVLTLSPGPWKIDDKARLSLRVGASVYTHVFAASDFRNPESVSGYEIAASVNRNTSLGFEARTMNSGLGLRLQARGLESQEIQVLEFPAALNLDTAPEQTLKLFLNDKLLSQDGQLALLRSRPQSEWQELPDPAQLVLAIDGVAVPLAAGTNTWTITASDFVLANTGYSTLSVNNSLESWAKVLQAKIPGTTWTVSAGSLQVVSNAGRQAEASLRLDVCDFTRSGIFDVSSSVGSDFDYVLERQRGQVYLQQPLQAGDRLSAGSVATRAFLESSVINDISIENLTTTVSGQLGAEFWLTLGPASETLALPLVAGTPIVVQNPVSTVTDRVQFVAAAGAFSAARAGDWLLVTDSAFAAANRGLFRISDVPVGGDQLTVERPLAWNSPESITLTNGLGLIVIRSETIPQRVYLPGGTGTLTATGIVQAWGQQVAGVQAAVYKTNRVRVFAKDYRDSLHLIYQNAGAQVLGFATGLRPAQTASAANLGSAADVTVPGFQIQTLASGTGTALTLNAGQTHDSLKWVRVLKSVDESSGGVNARQGPTDFLARVETSSGTSTTLRTGLPEWLPGQRLTQASSLGLSPVDNLIITTESQRYDLKLSRAVKPTGTVYALSQEYVDAEAGNLSLAATLGLDMDFRDWLVCMPARVKTDLSAGADTLSTILYRWKRLGADGNSARLNYVYSLAASQALSVAVNHADGAWNSVSIRLPSGPARTGFQVSNRTRIGLAAAAPVSGLQTLTAVLNLNISTGLRQQRLNYSAHTGTWTVGQTVTGATSGATAVIQTGSQLTGAAGFLILATVVGSFVLGENLTSPGNTAVANGTLYGVSVLTLALPPGITDHGLQIGDRIHAEYNGTGTGAGFVTTLTDTAILGVTPTTIEIREGLTAIGATAGIGTVSFDSQEARLQGSTVVSGDILNLGSASSVPSGYQGSAKIQALADGYQQVTKPGNLTPTTVLSWYTLNSTANISWFPVLAQTAAQIAAAVNAVVDSPVKAVAVGIAGVATGNITNASYEVASLGALDPWWYLSDGLNAVRSQTTPGTVAGNYGLVFKLPITANLANNSDWANEEIRLVPVTSAGLASWLRSPGPGGAFNRLEILDTGSRVQIASQGVGSESWLRVDGGSGQALAATVQGSATFTGTAAGEVGSGYTLVYCPRAQAQGFHAGSWVWAQNKLADTRRFPADSRVDKVLQDGTLVFGRLELPYGLKAAGFVAGETLTGAVSGAVATVDGTAGGLPGPAFGTVYLRGQTGTFQVGETLNGSQSGIACAQVLGAGVRTGVDTVWSRANVGGAPILGQKWQLENHGDYQALQWVSGSAPDLGTNALENAWLYLDGTTLAAANKGYYRILRVNNTSKTIWFQNPNLVPETQVLDLAILTADSIVPGTGLNISTSLLGAGNQGQWIVDSIENPLSAGSNRYLLRLRGPLGMAFPAGISGTLGAEAQGLRVDYTVAKLLKQIHSIAPSGDLLAIKFNSFPGTESLTEALGTEIVAADKLSFPASSRGRDAYRYGTGLLQQANKILYGVGDSSLEFPGLVAAGARVDIRGPVVRRLTVSLAVRRRAVSAQALRAQIRSAIAARVNSTGIGGQVSISDLVTAAASCQGVVSVQVLDPDPSVDVIVANAGEKLLILDLAADIQISFLGE